MTSPPRVAHVWLDGFFVAVERQADPSLEGRPVVIGGRPGTGARVVTASVEAMADGVVPGLSVDEARVRSPRAAFLPGDVERLLDAAALVAEAVYRVTRLVEWTAVDEATVLLPDADRGAAAQVAEQLRRAVRDAGFGTAVGIADGTLAARVAARMVAPDGLLVILPGYDARFLSGLDVGMLDHLPTATIRRLREHGVATLGHVGALAPDRALEWLGREGPMLANRCAGRAPNVAITPRLPRRLCRVHRLGLDELAPDGIARIAAALAETLAQRLRRIGALSQTVSVRVEAESGASTSRSFCLNEPTDGIDHLVPAARGLANHLMARGGAFRALSVSVGRLVQGEAQLSLFPARTERSRRGLEGLAVNATHRRRW